MSDNLVAAYRELMADVYELAGRSRATSESFAKNRGHTAARWHILSVILEEPHAVPEIAARLGLTRQSVQRVVNDLIAAGLAERVENPRHQRSKLVAITQSGVELASGLYRDSATIRGSQVGDAGLNRRDLDQARTTLRRVIDSLDKITET